jgi:hypothetical protein
MKNGLGAEGRISDADARLQPAPYGVTLPQVISSPK